MYKGFVLIINYKGVYRTTKVVNIIKEFVGVSVPTYRRNILLAVVGHLEYNV